MTEFVLTDRQQRSRVSQMRHKMLVTASVASSRARTFRNFLSAIVLEFISLTWYNIFVSVIFEAYDMVIGDDSQNSAKNHPVFSTHPATATLLYYTRGSANRPNWCFTIATSSDQCWSKTPTLLHVLDICFNCNGVFRNLKGGAGGTWVHFRCTFSSFQNLAYFSTLNIIIKNIRLSRGQAQRPPP